MTPTPVAGGLVFAAVIPAEASTCGVTTAGAVYCWGANDAGQLGDGSTIGRTSPVAVVGGLSFATVSTLLGHTCGVTTGGAVYCWGGNHAGQLGDGTTTNRSSPVAVQGGLTFATVSVGPFHTCGVTTAGAAYCWGQNVSGELGDGKPFESSRTSPVAVVGGLTFATVSLGYAHTCGVTTGGAAFCWGSNSAGQLGDRTAVDRSMPALVKTLAEGGLTVATLRTGGVYTCAVTSRYAAYCWGWNYHGQLGDGTTTNQASPVRVAPPAHGGT
ncbi:MAG TPA: hypothetical protein VM716_01900 [Gemmatimonadales bacterium]|nr:hypothetical protein [Gemmatimonadales bacterium]